MRAVLIASLIALTACGGGQKKKPEPIKKPPPVAKKPPPPPPPPCIKGGDAMGAIGSATGDADGAQFCVSDGSSNECFKADLASGKYDKLAEPPTAQTATVEPDDVKVETTPTEVKVCAGDDCKTVTPKVPKGSENQLVAVANKTTAVVMLGNTETGKGVAEVWDVAKNKKLATIKYAKADFKCGVPKLLGSTVYISASVCAGPAARGGLYNLKGKKIAEVGGKDFGTFSEVAIQVTGNLWAFLEENGSMVALQDVGTGKVGKTIQLGPLWTPEGGGSKDDDGGGSAPAMGNPGESALVRGGDNQLLVIAGGPSPGTVGVIDIGTGELKVVRAPLCDAGAASSGGDSGGTGDAAVGGDDEPTGGDDQPDGD